MFAHYFMQSMLALGGGIALLAAILNWDWFFETDTVRRWTCHCSRGRARFFYGFLGLLMVGMAVFAFLKS